MNQKKKVTYLLGAGASYHALPIVKNWNERIKYYVDVFLREVNKSGNWDIENLGAIINIYDKLIKQANKHATMDTFAKKLFLKKDWVNLWYLKNLICSFFQYEQIEIVNKYEGDIWRESEILLKHPKKKTILDKRYDAFFAALLNEGNGKLEFPEQINIISWNYDYQVELAYSDFSDCTIDEARKDLNIFPDSRSLHPNNPIKITPRIVKLNGTADLVNAINPKNFELDNLQSSTDSAFDDYEYKEVYEFLFYADRYYKDNSKNDLFYNLHFAWENDSLSSKQTLISAKKIINNTDILVIIGYSFPTFNREIDRQVFGQKLFSKIYIQALPEHIKGIKERFQGISAYPNTKYLPIEDLDNFFIPFEI